MRSDRRWVLTGIVGILGSWIFLRRFWAMDPAAYALGEACQNLWSLGSQLSHGEWRALSHGHFPLFWLAFPVFFIFPKPELILVFQAFCLALAGPAVDAIYSQYQKKPFQLGPSIVYWGLIAFSMPFIPIFDPYVWTLPFMLIGMAGLQSNHRWKRAGGAFSFALGLSTGFAAIPLGLLLGLGWSLGWGPAVSRSFTRKLGILVVGLSILILGLGYFTHTFSTDVMSSSQWILILEALIGVLVFWGISYLKIPENAWALLGGIAVAFWMTRTAETLHALPEHASWVKADVLPCLSYDVSISGPRNFYPHLVGRKQLATFDGRKLAGLGGVDCIIQDSEPSQAAALLDLGYHEVWSCRGLQLFEKGMAGCLTCRPNCR